MWLNATAMISAKPEIDKILHPQQKRDRNNTTEKPYYQVILQSKPSVATHVNLLTTGKVRQVPKSSYLQVLVL
jgi:hypothetical protein